MTRFEGWHVRKQPKAAHSNILYYFQRWEQETDHVHILKRSALKWGCLGIIQKKTSSKPNSFSRVGGLSAKDRKTPGGPPYVKAISFAHFAGFLQCMKTVVKAWASLPSSSSILTTLSTDSVQRMVSLLLCMFIPQETEHMSEKSVSCFSPAHRPPSSFRIYSKPMAKHFLSSRSIDLWQGCLWDKDPPSIPWFWKKCGTKVWWLCLRVNGPQSSLNSAGSYWKLSSIKPC